MRTQLFFIFFVISFLCIACGNKNNTIVKKDVIENNKISKSGYIIPSDVYGVGDSTIHITVVGHGSLMFEFDDKIIHIDPYSNVADYGKLPKADLIVLTHEHTDHLDTIAINTIKDEHTEFIVSKLCNQKLGYGDVINNGEKKEWGKVTIEAVPAYNIVNKRENGEPYHPKGQGNGYIFTFGDKKIYVAGDTENIPEMQQLNKQIDIAFLPKNLPYTMTDEMFIDAAKSIMPKVLYPYHMSEFDQKKISKALDGANIELRIRPMMNK